jgi:hypothetical protein
MKLPAAKWASEAAMLCAFRDILRGFGAECFGEAGGHDMLVRVTADFLARCTLRGPRGRFVEQLEAGDIIAVEGKLRASFHVLAQAMPPGSPSPHGHYWHGNTGPDFSLVVVPDEPEGFAEVATACGIGVAVMLPERQVEDWRRTRTVPAELHRIRLGARIVGLERTPLPTLDVDVTPGLPSPSPITGWKVGAVTLCLLAATRPLTRDDFRRHDIDARRFLTCRWMTCEGRGKAAIYRLADPAPGNRPDLWYRDIAAAVLARGPLEPPPAPVAVPGALGLVAGGAA